MDNIVSSINAAVNLIIIKCQRMLPIGKQLKQSVNVFHNLMLYRLLHSS